jgi:hypothetical protein
MAILTIDVLFVGGNVVDPLYDAAGPPWTGLETNATKIENFHNSGTDITGDDSFLDGSIATANIAANAVQSGNIANDAVLEHAMADGCIGNAELKESVNVPPVNPNGPIYDKHINWAGMTSGRLLRVEGVGGSYTMGRAIVSGINMGVAESVTGSVLWAAFADGDPSFNTPVHATTTLFGFLDAGVDAGDLMKVYLKLIAGGTGVDYRITRVTASGATSIDLYIFVLGKP